MTDIYGAGPEGESAAHEPIGSSTRDHDPAIPADILASYRARVLDPLAAERLRGQERLRNTAYVADRLLLTADAGEESLGLIREAAARFGLEVTLEPRSSELPDPIAVVEFRPGTDEPVPPADAWKILQWARSSADRNGIAVALRGAGLDHLLFASVGVIRRRRPPAQTGPLEAGPPSSPSTISEDAAIDDYGRPGGGGRQSVAWLGPPPQRRADHELHGRRPVVAILDNGCGLHPWLADVVSRDLMIDGEVIGYHEPEVDPEVSGTGDQRFDDSVDAVAGHGTFMAGLVHMFCPDAAVCAIRVVNPDGVALESEVVRALSRLAELVRRWRMEEPGGAPLDVLVLSMGYYHETSSAASYSALARVLQVLGELGVMVVVAAGNDATARPMYPAALASPQGDGPLPSASRIPVLSVGANNPDGSAAMFSNSGPWVTSWQLGASVVSTMPVTFHAGMEPAPRSPSTRSLRQRRPLDPDDFRTGFAVWSGTSFAAPVLGGQLAAALLDACSAWPLHMDQEGVGSAVERAWWVLSRSVGVRQP